MRRLLLASAAMLGLAFGIASAQTPWVAFQPSQGMVVAPSAANAIANSSNNTNEQLNPSRGYANTFFGVIPAPRPGGPAVRSSHDPR
jgi:hypothetical protein